jgi:GDPmannose 4,6-dehydratase
MSKNFLIFGASGQDGSILCDRLVQLGHTVVAVVSPSSQQKFRLHADKVTLLSPRLHISETDYSSSSVRSLFGFWEPDIIVKCSGQSYVSKSWKLAEVTADSQYRFTCALLDCLAFDKQGNTKLIDLGSSEIFKYCEDSFEPLNELSPIGPRNPYGFCKSASYSLTKNFRECQGLKCMTAILFPHESKRRGLDFATMRFARQLSELKMGLTNKIRIGDMRLIRDWSYAHDIVEGIIKLAVSPIDEDFIFCSGRGMSIKEVISIMADGIGIKRVESFIEEDPRLMRIEDPPIIVGDAQKAKTMLNWDTEVQPEDFLVEIVRDQLNYQKK